MNCASNGKKKKWDDVQNLYAKKFRVTNLQSTW